MIKRELEKQIDPYLFRGKAIILFGPRQSGKTTLLEAILARLKEIFLTLNSDESDIRELLIIQHLPDFVQLLPIIKLYLSMRRNEFRK